MHIKETDQRSTELRKKIPSLIRIAVFNKQMEEIRC